MTRPLVIMPCLDMIAGRVVKGVRVVDLKDAGAPVECCRAYCEAGADELAMLDITATLENRSTLLDVTRRVADAVTVPFTMGGGISSVKAAEEVLNAGANKFSTSSAAFRNPTVCDPEMEKRHARADSRLACVRPGVPSRRNARDASPRRRRGRRHA